MKTNEQAVADAENRLDELKQAYMAVVQPLALKISQKTGQPDAEELLACYQAGNRYYNYLETFVGQSDLLGAHLRGLWVTGFAETCLSVLKAYTEHITFLRSHQKTLSVSQITPDANAFANMQRMVKKYLPEQEWREVYTLYKTLALPVTGFEVAAQRNTLPLSSQQQLLSIAIGILLVSAVFIFSVMKDLPTPWQQLVMRACLAIGLSAVAVPVSGFLSVNARIQGRGNYLKVVSGGAIAIFVLIWFVTPGPV